MCVSCPSELSGTKGSMVGKQSFKNSGFLAILSKPWTPHLPKENSHSIGCFLIDEAKKIHFDFIVASFELVDPEFK